MKPARVLALLAAACGAATAADCDRDCLRSVITQYLDAMIAHNPAKLPLGARVRFTEDTVEMRLGEGLWKNASKIRPYRLDILDVRLGVAASQVIVEEAGSPVMLMLRMKMADMKITEVETQVTRTQKEGLISNTDALQTAPPGTLAAPERSQLASREEAIRIAQLYPAGLKIGSFAQVGIHFASDSYRRENGIVTWGVGCLGHGCTNMNSQSIMRFPAMAARVAAVDEEMGIVLLRMNFGDTRSYEVGKTLIAWEAFKIFGGKIHGIETFMRLVPAAAVSGWD